MSSNEKEFPEEPATYGAILASAAWPLYWSIQITQFAQKGKA